MRILEILHYNQLFYSSINRKQIVQLPYFQKCICIFFAFIILVFVLYGNVYAQENVFPGKEWEERTPESQGIDSGKLEEALKQLENMSGADGIKEVVVIRNGYMIWKGSRIDSLHNLASITKAFTSTCFGLLVDRGKCSIDDFAADYEPRLRGNYPEYEKIRFRHFATMTSGYDGKGGTYPGDADDGSKTPFIVSKPVFPPGMKYSYWDDAMCMFGLVITKIARKPLYNLFKESIADPINMNPVAWYWEDFGEIDGFLVNQAQGGINMTARELARLGLLFLNKGKWDGKQLVSTKWVEEATKVQVPNTMEGRDDTPRQKRISKTGPGCYGFHWWANGILSDGKRILPDAPPGTFWRSGWPKQRMFIIPEWNIVIVRIGRDEKRADRPVDVNLCWNATLKKIGEAITTDKTEIKGEKKVWQTVTIDFKGPYAVESDNNLNPFIDYRLQVIFTGPGGQAYNVPGFFDGDGKGDASGNVWRVRFTPDQPGEWIYRAILKRGKNIAVNIDKYIGQDIKLNSSKGVFEVAPADKTAGGFLGKGRLVHEKGAFYLKTI